MSNKMVTIANIVVLCAVVGLIATIQSANGPLLVQVQSKQAEILDFQLFCYYWHHDLN